MPRRVSTSATSEQPATSGLRARAHAPRAHAPPVRHWEGRRCGPGMGPDGVGLALAAPAAPLCPVQHHVHVHSRTARTRQPSSRHRPLCKASLCAGACV
eukprot:scaffold19698_cov59-Phaeocystis_antarctica.AAC.5